jgi:tryptophan aminotransferase
LPIRFGLEAIVCRDPSGTYSTVSALLVADQQGFVTGPTDILNSMDVTTASKLARPNQNRKLTISELLAPQYKLLKNWGVDGFLSHSDAVAAFYAERREKFEFFARKHLDGLADWVSPVAGMFLWIDLSRSGIEDSFELIREKAMAKGVLAVPGKA